MKPLSDEVKSEIRRLASMMLDVISRARVECEVTSEAEADLMMSMVDVELQTELVRHLNSGESGTSVLENRESTASLAGGIARADALVPASTTEQHSIAASLQNEGPNSDGWYYSKSV